MPDPGPPELLFAIRGPITRADLPGLCDRVCAILGQNGETVVCDVDGVEPDAVTVDALARLQLAASRRGRRVTLRNASAPLLELVAFMGLSDVCAEGEEERRPATADPVPPGRGMPRPRPGAPP